MSLDFSVERVKDHTNVTTAPFEFNGKSQWHPLTNALVWGSIPCGYNEITEANLDEVWFRVNLWQGLVRSLLSDDKGAIWLSKKDLEMHIGLITNAGRKTRTEFYKTLETVHLREPAGAVAMERIGWKGRPANAS